MCKILLSINPEHVANILNGSKKVEYRKVTCRCDVDKILIYSTSPVMKVVGEAAVLEIIEDSPDNVWRLTSQDAGITRSFFDKYYEDKSKAVAFKLGKVTKYNKPLSLSDLGVNSAPQSFVYL
jgi:predicted transcriptional regulator